jgi:hypothetical protein
MFEMPPGPQLPKIATEDFVTKGETDRFYPDAEIQTAEPYGLDQDLVSRRPNSPLGSPSALHRYAIGWSGPARAGTQPLFR